MIPAFNSIQEQAIFLQGGIKQIRERLPKHVVQALNKWNVIEGDLKSRKARKQVQAVFNEWMQESNQPLCHISMILALSVD